VLQTFAGADADAGGAATGGDPGAFALGMTGCNKRERCTAEQSMVGRSDLFPCGLHGFAVPNTVTATVIPEVAGTSGD
jgi:hypothetical protein